VTEPAARSASRFDDSWLDSGTDEETLTETSARGGALSNDGRRAAIAAALPLLGVYFASGNQPLFASPALGRRQAEQERTDLLCAIRLRVALAAAMKLRLILARIVDRPTFRYQLVEAESAGALTGQIDVNRFTIKKGPVAEMPVYPVTEVRRLQNTPENVLAVYAALWLLRELREAFTGCNIAIDGPERREYSSQRQALDKMIVLPSLAGCLPAARQVSRGRTERNLIRQVSVRLRRREVSNASPYSDLVSWIRQSLDGGAAADPGEIDWAFYGDRFDTKLFELWCLQELAQEVSRQLAVDPPSLNRGWRSTEAAYTWDRPAGVLKLHFQHSLPTVSRRFHARWHKAGDGDRTLGGVPDIVAHAIRRIDGQERVAIVDPKLRQRGGPPTEELYKILGYFDNFSLASAPFGAIIYHTTNRESHPQYHYEIPDNLGHLYAVALNPAASTSLAGLIPIARMLLELLDIPPLSDNGIDSNSADPESLAEAQFKARLAELGALSLSLPTNVLDMSRRRVQAVIGDGRWSVLSSDVQTMLATSEYVGFSLDVAADFSGPVIGICASVEVLLHEQIIDPAFGDNADLHNSCRTLGQVIHATRSAMVLQNNEVRRAIARQLNRMQVNSQALGDLLDELSEMNTQYRIPAAHRELVADSKWRSAWSTLIGSEKLLATTIDLLVIDDSST
jgi:hypothetical protein